VPSLRRRVSRFLRDAREVNRILRVDAEERRFLTKAYDDRVPVPESARVELTPDNPTLQDLRARYAELDVAAVSHAQWSQRYSDMISEYLRHFRGDTPYVWHYRESQKVTRLKFFIFLQHVAAKDDRNLLGTLEEDGAFGCWHYDYPGHPTVSRDLLDSINEILFLDRQLQVFERPELRILDIGAGYGRLAHRMLTALPNVTDYCCVDAIPESTFLCDFYLGHRGLKPGGRSVALDRVETLSAGAFDLAVNIHSFSECTMAAVDWWVAQLERLEVPRLLVVPNEPDELLTNEGHGKRLDFRPRLESAGYRLTVHEPVLDDPGVRDTVGVHDHFFLFERT